MAFQRLLRRLLATPFEFGAKNSEIVVGELGQLCEMAQQTRLQRLVAVDRDRKPDDTATLAVDMVTAVYAKQRPASSLDDPSEVPTGH